MDPRIFLLIDKHDNFSYSFIKRLTRWPLKEVYPPISFNQIKLQWFTGVIKVLHLSRRGDVIVCLFDFQAVFAAVLCALFCLKREIICVNLLLDQNAGIKNRLVSKMYRKALSFPFFHASVTSVAYGEWLNQKLGTCADFTLLRDVMLQSYEMERKDIRPNVFCGGRNGRDWKFLYELAADAPEINFSIIVPTAVNTVYHFEKLQNVTCMTDVGNDVFMKELCRSSILCMPLSKQAPAGLIVMFQAAANRIPIIATSTVTTREYLSDGRGILLGNDVSAWHTALSAAVNARELQQMADRFYAFCVSQCSEEVFVLTLDKMIAELYENPSCK